MPQKKVPHQRLNLRGLLRGAGLASVIVVVGGTLALAQSASASPVPRIHVIDTNRVVGFPQRLGIPAAQSSHGASAPVITGQPSNETVAAGSVATFAASATGSPTPRVQWQSLSPGGRSWSNIYGGNFATYQFTPSSGYNGYEFRAVFSNRSGTATTNPAILTVTSTSGTSPSITSSPQSETVASGSPASFSASATGSPVPTVAWQFSANSGASWSTISGANTTTYSFTANSSENGYEYEAVFTNTHGHATTNPATLTVTTNSVPLEASTNWSGYADVGSSFTSVSSSWTVPTVTCTRGENAYSAQWIGIDGYSSPTVEQDGTEADCLSGTPSYDAWYEMFGDNAVNSGFEVELDPGTYPVQPGETITARVSAVGTTWTLAISDSSGWTYSTNISFSGGAKTSAEWIVERPEICFSTCSLASLPNFGSVTFSNASTTSNGTPGGILSFSAAAIEMVNGSVVLSVPGAYEPNIQGFTDTWQAI